jgi:predicted methyltransferase
MTSTPLLTSSVLDQLQAARKAAAPRLECSLDLGRSSTHVDIDTDTWMWRGCAYPYPTACKDRTIYFWNEDHFDPAARYSTALIKLVPTDWGAPTFEIDGIKMLPTSQVSPYADAGRKVTLIHPRDRVVLDTCGGLGYFAAWCLEGGARHVASFEKNADVLWLRGLNPWSPGADARLQLTHSDVTRAIIELGDATFDAVLHDPPRFGIAGELYSQQFYDHLARVLKRRGRLFHYTGTPNRRSSGRDLAAEVAQRLRSSGFAVEPNGDGLLGIKQ